MPRTRRQPRLAVVFYKTEAGNGPVREWLRSLARQDRKAIGDFDTILSSSMDEAQALVRDHPYLALAHEPSIRIIEIPKG